MMEACERSSAASSCSPSALTFVRGGEQLGLLPVDDRTHLRSGQLAPSDLGRPRCRGSEIGLPGEDGLGVRTRRASSQRRHPRGLRAFIASLRSACIWARMSKRGDGSEMMDFCRATCARRRPRQPRAGAGAAAALPRADRAITRHLLQEEPGVRALPRGSCRSLRRRAARAR